MAERIDNGGSSGDIGCVPGVSAARTRAQFRAPQFLACKAPAMGAGNFQNSRERTNENEDRAYPVRPANFPIGTGTCKKFHKSRKRTNESENPAA